MADPQLTDHFRCQLVLKHKSGNPKDVTVTSFVFKNLQWIGNPDDFATHASNAIKDFYTVIPPAHDGGGAVSRLDTFLPTDMILSPAQVRTYDLGKPKGERFPIIREFPITPQGGWMPEEVAVCLSLVAGQNLKRRRGRVYFGPLNATGLEIDPNGRVRVKETLRRSLAANATRLMGVNGLGWSVLSQMDAVARPISGGWVDNAPDTIRSRGASWTQRSLWGSYEGKPAGWIASA